MGKNPGPMPDVRPANTRLDEFGLIDRYFRPLATEAGAFGLTDDAALIDGPGRDEIVVSSDMVVEGVHFFPDDTPGSVARKALRVNLSDLAAKGAEPSGYLLSLALPASWTENWVARFCRGLKGDQTTYGLSLLGGDTVRSPWGTMISIVALGRLPRGRAVLRSGARPGDAVFVTGTIGDAALGLLVRRGEISSGEAGRGAGRLVDRYLHPRPRVDLALTLRRHASAALDISDGLWADLAHLCAASGVGADIDVRKIPLSRPALRLVKADGSRLATVITGGDDYEILATVDAKRAARFEREARAARVPVTRIGQIVTGATGPTFFAGEGRKLQLSRTGHTHF